MKKRASDRSAGASRANDPAAAASRATAPGTGPASGPDTGPVARAVPPSGAASRPLGDRAPARGRGRAPAGGQDSGEITQLLLRHYDATRRDLPWRRETDPYRVWVSEVMLQQTRVETVVPYYLRWLERFPSLAELAEAPPGEVLKHWEGLGYYSRARNLQRAARLVRERHGGTLPSDPQLLRDLPGFGSYTAGAVASIAFGRRLPAVDGNVRRVLARLYDVAGPSAAWLRDAAAALVPAERPGDFNQALMELGATLCRPRAPRCEVCPLAGSCLARRRGTVAERPARKRRPLVRSSELASAVVGGAEGWLLRRNPAGGLLAGLWSFPALEPRPGERPVAAAVRAAAAAGVQVPAAAARELPAVRHDFSHLRATYRPFHFPAPERPGPLSADVVWADDEALRQLALPVAQRRIAALVGCA